MYSCMQVLSKNFKEQTWIDWIIKVLMRTTHVSGRASWTHKLVLVRHFPLIKKSYIVKSKTFFFYNSWSERVEEKQDWVVKLHLITNIFSLVYLLDYLRLPLVRPFLLLVLCQKSDQKKKKSRKSRRTAIINWQFSVKNEQAIVKKHNTILLKNKLHFSTWFTKSTRPA